MPIPHMRNRSLKEEKELVKVLQLYHGGAQEVMTGHRTTRLTTEIKWKVKPLGYGVDGKKGLISCHCAWAEGVEGQVCCLLSWGTPETAGKWTEPDLKAHCV